MKRIFFFATPADIKPVLERFEQISPIKFVKNGLQTSITPLTYFVAEKIPDPGVSTSETGSTSISYLVSPLDSPDRVVEHVSTAEDTAGQTFWSVYNGFNEDTIVMTLAGLWGEDILLPGNVSTMHDTKTAQQLMRRFLAALKKEDFVKVHSWWLGKEAMAMLKNGKRLTTTAVQSPPDYDLKLENIE